MTKEIKKIDTSVNMTTDTYKTIIKKDRKEAFGTTRESFINTTIHITWEQGLKLDQFVTYCKQFLCAYCIKKSPIDNFHSNMLDELVLLCPNCGAETIDGFKESKDYVRWFNDILKDYGMSFKDGFPKLITTRSKVDSKGYQETRTWQSDHPTM